MFGRKNAPETSQTGSVAISLARVLEETVRRYKKRESIRFENRVYTYQEMDEEANKIAGGLASLGITRGDRVAMMLPNIPEFVFCFFGIQKLGAIAVPFNTMYKGREISHILRDSGARAIICLSNFSNLIQEIQRDCPALEHIIITGQRTFVYVDTEGSVNIQLVFEKTRFETAEAAWHGIGGALVNTFHTLGAKEAWYSHRGAVRSSGKKMAIIVLSEIENLYICNIMTYLKPMDSDPLFKVIYVPAEIKERALEPMTSIFEESGTECSVEKFKDALTASFGKSFGIRFEEGKLTRDEIIAYEKNRALAGRTAG